jgi:hypothetical protein
LSRTICVCVFFRSAFSILLGKENIHIVSHLLLLDDGDGDGRGRKKGDRRDAGWCLLGLGRWLLTDEVTPFFFLRLLLCLPYVSAESWKFETRVGFLFCQSGQTNKRPQVAWQEDFFLVVTRSFGRETNTRKQNKKQKWGKTKILKI